MTSGAKEPYAEAALDAALARGARFLEVTLDPCGRRKLLDFIGLMVKWNAVYNLTAIREPAQMLVQHVLDSLAIVPALAATKPAAVLDVGSGSGLPGVVVAVAIPGVRVTLNDAVQKKSAFQRQVKALLRLDNLTVVNGRVESLARVPACARFDAIVSRAFAELADFITLARDLLAPGGSFWAMKGARPDAEIERLPGFAVLHEIIRLRVPGLPAQRHLVRLGLHV